MAAHINNSISYFPFLLFLFFLWLGGEKMHFVNIQPSFTFTALYFISIHLPPPPPHTNKHTHTPTTWLWVLLPGLLWIFWGSSSGVFHWGTRWSVYPPYNRVGTQRGRRINWWQRDHFLLGIIFKSVTQVDFDHMNRYIRSMY